MSENLSIWHALEKTDPKHTKAFKRAGGFSGTAVAPIYMTRRMTEMFGPAGKGWGMGDPAFRTVEHGDEVLVFCTVPVWWEEHSQTVYGVGGDKAVTKRRDGGLFYDDEAFKKAYTDALSNAFKQLGMAADIHMGLYDDSKYVNSLRAEFANENGGQQPAAQPAQKPAQKQIMSGPHQTPTALKQAAGALMHDIMGTADEQELDGLLADNAATIEQIKRDVPTWWAGKPGTDELGMSARIENHRRDLRERDPAALMAAG